MGFTHSSQQAQQQVFAMGFNEVLTGAGRQTISEDIAQSRLQCRVEMQFWLLDEGLRPVNGCQHRDHATDAGADI